MKIRNYRDSDAQTLAELFHRAVQAIDDRCYSPQQRQAWSPSPPDYPAWRRRLERTQPLVAVSGKRIAGFIELEADGHIDCLYVDPVFQRQGVARLLIDNVIDLARKRQLTQLRVEASKVATAVFISAGFSLESENAVQRSGQRLINYRMVRLLSV